MVLERLRLVLNQMEIREESTLAATRVFWRSIAIGTPQLEIEMLEAKVVAVAFHDALGHSFG